MIHLSVMVYIKKVYFNVIIVTVISAIVPLIVAEYLEESFINFIFLSLISVVSVFITVFYVGCNVGERMFILSKIKAAKQRIIKNDPNNR